MHRFRFTTVVAALLLSFSIIAIAGAQTVPSLFIGTVRDASNSALPGAQVTGKVSGEVCGESTSGTDGSYGLVIPDTASRPAACSVDGAQVELSVNNTVISTETKGAAGSPVTVDLKLTTATPSPTPTVPAGLTLALNGPAVTGVNSAAVIGPPITSTQIKTAAEAQSGLTLSAIWLFRDGSWLLYLPGLIDDLGTLTPPVSLFFIFA